MKCLVGVNNGCRRLKRECSMIVARQIKAILAFILLQCLLLYISYTLLKNANPLICKQLELSTDKRGDSMFVYPEERERFDWEDVLEPCKSDMQWRSREFGQETGQRSKAMQSVLIDQEINPPGYYSKFTFQSRTNDGRNKTIGGDYWRAYLTGSGLQRGLVRDLNDGKYEAWFLITEPGNYQLNLLLEHTLCDGLRDPPLGWFERGNIHGRFQEEGILGYIDDFFQENVTLLHFSVKNSLGSETNGTGNAKRISPRDGSEQMNCSMLNSQIGESCFSSKTFERNCKLVWNGHGRWKRQGEKYTWLPNFPEVGPVDYSSKEKLQTLWFLGDSLTYRLWDSSYTRVLCRKAFKNCKKTYIWVYEIGNGGESKVPINVGIEFNYTRFFEPLHSILNSADMKSNRSVVIINYGLHLVMSLNFSEYRNLIDKFIAIVDHYRLQQNESSVPQFVWKTTTMSHKENTERWNMTQARFLTNHRISLFNAYSNARLCTAGITILDIFPISASFPEGTKDHVHYHYFVFEPAEDALADFVWRNYN